MTARARRETLTIGRLCAELELFARLSALSARTGRWCAVQRELVGPGIQKNPYGLTAPAFFVFHVLAFDPHGTPAALVDHAEMIDVAGELRRDTVPPLGTTVLDHSVDDLVDMSRGGA